MKRYILLLLFLACGFTPLYSPKHAASILPKLVIIPTGPVMSIVNSNHMTGITLAWDYDTNNTNVYKFTAYWGISSHSYTSKKSYPAFVKGSMRLSGSAGPLLAGTNYFFAVTASSINGESDYSSELAFTMPYTYNTVTLSWIPAVTNSIYSSTNLKTWIMMTNAPPPLTRPRDKPAEFFMLR